MSGDVVEPMLVLLARGGVRHVRTPEGSKKYGLPIGAIITRDAVIRAKLRFPNMKVPEDTSGGPGTNTPGAPRVAPKAPRPRINAKKMAEVLANSPDIMHPVAYHLDGPHPIQVGDHSFNVPDGSRVYRLRNDNSVAIIRQPNFDLVMVTTEGHSVDLKGDTEHQLNEGLDDLKPNDLDFSVEDFGTPGTASNDPGSPTAGYVSEEATQSVLTALRTAGAPQELIDSTEASIRKNNERIRNTDPANTPDGNAVIPDSAPNAPSAPSSNRPNDGAPKSAPTRGQVLELPDGKRGLVQGPGADGDHVKVFDGWAMRDVPWADARVVRSTPDKQANDLLTHADQSGSASPRRAARLHADTTAHVSNRALDDVTHNDISTPTPSVEPDYKKMSDTELDKFRLDTNNSVSQRAAAVREQRRRQQATPRRADRGLSPNTDSAPRRGVPARQTADLTPTQMTDAELHDVVGDLQLAEAAFGSAFTDAGRQRLDALMAEQVRRQKLDVPSPEGPARPTLSEAAADPASFGPEALHGDILNARVGDVFMGYGPFSGDPNALWEVQPNGRVRRIEGGIPSEYSRRTFANTLTRQPTASTNWGMVYRWSGNDSNSQPRHADVVPAPRISTDLVTEDTHRYSAAELQHLDATPGSSDFPQVAERTDILNARSGDRFLTHSTTADGRSSNDLWGVGADGSMVRLSEGDAVTMSRSLFANGTDPNSIYAFSGNESNHNNPPDLLPGEPTTHDWAAAVEPGAAAYDGEGVLRDKSGNDTWSSELGTVHDEFFTPSDVANSDPTVVRSAPEPDGRPVGASTRITTTRELAKVPLGDSVSAPTSGGNVSAERLSDGTWDVHLPSGLHFGANDEQMLAMSDNRELWHVPNQDVVGAPSRTSWSAGDRLKSLDDLLAQAPGTRINYQFRRPRPDGVDHSVYSVLPDGRVQREGSPNIYPADMLRRNASNGQLSVIDVPEQPVLNVPEIPPVANLEDYKVGDLISSHRHLRDMSPGQQVTLTIPASRNGGRATTVLLTRTNDNDLGGFMFLVGRRGAGYNALGENNANIFQAIHDNRLYFGDLSQLDGENAPQFMSGDWSTEKNIDLGFDDVKVSEHDLRTFIDSQVYSRAMQGSYFNVDLLPLGNPFRSQVFRNKFAELAMAEYSTPGHPYRHKPAMIRFAAKKLGLEYTDPGAALIPDDLTLEDFRTKVTVGKFANRNGLPSAEAALMGPESMVVTVADLKAALVALDNMDVMTKADENRADKILKRVMAMRGSALQDMNVSLGIAAYFGMKRSKNGRLMANISAARQHDKRRNKDLLRQMLREQLEGRPPGFYGIPEPEHYSRNGIDYVNYSTLQAPSTPNVPDVPSVAAVTPDITPNVPDTPNVSAPTVGDTFIASPEVLDAIPTGHFIYPVNPTSAEAGTVLQRAADGNWHATIAGVDVSFNSDRLSRSASSFRYAGDISPSIPPESTPRTPDAPSTPAVPSTPDPLHTLPDGYAPLPEGSRVLAQRNHDGTYAVETPSGAVDFYYRSGFNSEQFSTVEEFNSWDGGVRSGFWTPTPAESATPGAPELLTVGPDGATISAGQPFPQRTRPGIALILRRVPEGHWVTTSDGQSFQHQADGSWTGMVDGVGVTRITSDLYAINTTWTYQGSHLPDGSTSPGLRHVDDLSTLASLPVGTRVRVTRLNGTTFEAVFGANSYGAPTLLGVDNPDIGLRVGPDWASRLGYLGYSFDVHEGPQTTDARFVSGGTFQGADIESAPVGIRVRGASGTEYTVTATGVTGVEGYPSYSFDDVRNRNALFTTLDANGSSTPGSSGSGGMTVGAQVTQDNLRTVPNGHYVRLSSGGVSWRRSGSVLISTNGQVRQIRNLPSSARYTYLGESANSQGVRIARPTTTTNPGTWVPTPASVVTRYDTPHDEPSVVGFNRDNTDPIREYLSTSEGAQDLADGVKEALRQAGVENPHVTVSGWANGFSVRYTTPRGTTSLSRSYHGSTRVENGQANSSGGYMTETQEALFAFYRQHGIQDVEVHGLSSSGWNGAHTWVRRGFRPHPDYDSANLSLVRDRQRALDRIIADIRNGRLDGHYNQFLSEAEQLSRDMKDLMDNYASLQDEARRQRLYELLRSLTYLGEMQDANGHRVTRPKSLGWRLLGDTSHGADYLSGSAWYYGLIDFADYFTERT